MTSERAFQEKKNSVPFLFTVINKMTVVSISIQKINTSVNFSNIIFLLSFLTSTPALS